MKFIVSWAPRLALLISTACSSTQIIRNSEYKTSEAAFRAGDIYQAAQRFPQKEKGGFITSIEKSYLGFWLGGKENQELLKQVSTLDGRRYTRISQEAQYFFYNESEDGYIPAEHEIIIMHMLNSMLFMRQEKWTEARVEARKATLFLQNYFKEDQDHFDDPALRLWLSGLWAALGEWQEAQVDLRKAYELTHNKALLPLLDLDHAPKDYSVVFNGAGPEVSWRDQEINPQFNNGTSLPPYKISFPTMPWYQRHLLRNTKIRDVVMKSNYMAQYYGLNTAIGAEKSLGFVVSNSLRATGVLVGTAIIAAGVVVAAEASSSAGEIITYATVAGISTGTWMWDEGDKVAKSTDLSTQAHRERGLEEMRTYRFVRFMPNWISVTDKSTMQSPINSVSKLQAPFSKTNVSFVLEF